MTDEQKYAELLKEMGQLLADKNTTISCHKYTIQRLEAELKKAEAERDAARADLKKITAFIAGERVDAQHINGKESA